MRGVWLLSIKVVTSVDIIIPMSYNGIDTETVRWNDFHTIFLVAGILAMVTLRVTLRSNSMPSP